MCAFIEPEMSMSRSTRRSFSRRRRPGEAAAALDQARTGCGGDRACRRALPRSRRKPTPARARGRRARAPVARGARRDRSAQTSSARAPPPRLAAAPDSLAPLGGKRLKHGRRRLVASAFVHRARFRRPQRAPVSSRKKASNSASKSANPVGAGRKRRPRRPVDIAERAWTEERDRAEEGDRLVGDDREPVGRAAGRRNRQRAGHRRGWRSCPRTGQRRGHRRSLIRPPRQAARRACPATSSRSSSSLSTWPIERRSACGQSPLPLVEHVGGARPVDRLGDARRLDQRQPAEAVDRGDHGARGRFRDIAGAQHDDLRLARRVGIGDPVIGAAAAKRLVAARASGWR